MAKRKTDAGVENVDDETGSVEEEGRQEPGIEEDGVEQEGVEEVARD
jgi:hypothetical protein